MGAGRPPKLTEVKVMQGTYRADHELPNPAQPALVGDIPAPPEGLPLPAQNEWYVVARWLHEIGQLATTDLTLLASYCNELSLYWHYDKKVKEKGAVLEFYDAAENLVRVSVNPYATLRSGALSNALRLASQFGLTPVMRSRITQAPPKKQENPLHKIMNRANR